MDRPPTLRASSLRTLLSLKQVFDLLEPLEGCVRPQHVATLASRFGSIPQEQAKKFVECFDPNSQGRISFLNFCFGVLAIKGFQRLPHRSNDITYWQRHPSPKYQV
ncbi:unnamed protein product [Knipowitschia caucasica]